MILKKSKRTDFQKNKAAMIDGLVHYVLAHKDEEGTENGFTALA